MMASGRYFFLLLAYLTTISGFSISFNDQSRGRKLFGGYRIVPKTCQPTNLPTIKSNEPAICMFNYECSRRNGQVVGACMDGFLFGACCQLPPASSSPSDDALHHSAANPPLDFVADEIDHVPDIPILLNPDGTPVLLTTSNQQQTKIKPSEMPDSGPQFAALIAHQGVIDDLSQPSPLTHSDANNDIQESKEPPAIEPVATLLSPDQVLQINDPVDQLPSLFSQALGTNNHSGAETILINKNGTIIHHKIEGPDFLFKPANRSTLSPNYHSTSESSTTRMDPVHYMNTHKNGDATTTKSELIRVPTINSETQSGNKKHDDQFHQEEIAINHIISILDGSTPKIPGEVPPHTTAENGPSSIHTWVTIEDTSVPSTSTEKFPYTFYKPSTRPSTYYYYDSPGSTPTGIKSDTTRPHDTSFSTSRYPSTYSSSSSSYAYSTKPTINPPAPTVIVLGPLGTSEYTTGTSPKPVITRKPISSSIRPTLVTKKPSVGTTITHNINTVISTDSSAVDSTNSNIISTSYINVKLQESTGTSSSTLKPSTEKDALITGKPSTVWTTLSTWSSKPSFQLRPGKPDFDWPQDNLTPVHTVILKATQKPLTTSTGSDCDNETAAPDDLSNFPPDRNPNLTNSTPTSQQEKPTIVETFNNTGYPDIEIVSGNEIPTPSFIEDEVLTNKVDDFVHKIVDSLQGNFEDLKDVVYTKKNVTIASNTVTRRPVTTKKPASKPTGNKRPVITKKPSTQRPSIGVAKPVKVTKPKPIGTGGSTTKRPSVASTSKRPKPIKKITVATSTDGSSTTLASTTVKITVDDIQPSAVETTESNDVPVDYRKECGVRPLIKRARVVGGKGATFGEWPWQVLVREATWLGLFTKNKCGGVLITDKYVITAAHCQPGFLASLVAVFGEFDISGEFETRRSISRNVRRVIVHRGYNPATFENDLALLELETPVQFDAHIVPICLPDDDADFTGRMATVTGWGRVKYNGGVPSVLQEVQVPVMENAVCQEMFRTAGHSKLILDSFLCAGYANGQKDSCEGDSGGPLMMERPDGRWVLVGTVSHGIKCAAPYLPGVYMRTKYFKPWLLSVTSS